MGHDTRKGGPTGSGANKELSSPNFDMDIVAKGGGQGQEFFCYFSQKPIFAKGTKPKTDFFVFFLRKTTPCAKN